MFGRSLLHTSTQTGMQNQEMHYGTNSYKYINKLIKESKELSIISPYIDLYYAKYLLRHAKGKSIRILSSSISKDAKNTITKTHGLLSFLISALFLIASGLATFVYFPTNTHILIGLLLGTSFLIITVTSAIATFVYLFVYLTDRRLKKGIMLKVPKRFIHAKLYIGDSYAIEGSANLTFAGTHENIEQIRVVKGQQEINELKREFERLWREA